MEKGADTCIYEYTICNQMVDNYLFWGQWFIKLSSSISATSNPVIQMFNIKVVYSLTLCSDKQGI